MVCVMCQNLIRILRLLFSKIIVINYNTSYEESKTFLIIRNMHGINPTAKTRPN